jgi:hypothetical protein
MMTASAPVLEKIDAADPGLLALVQRYIEHSGDVPLGLPTWWVGVRDEERLYAACGITPVTAGIRIDYLLFDGTVTGFRQMVKLADSIDAKFAAYTIFFTVKADNRLMRSLFSRRYCASEATIGYRREAR